MHDKTGRDYVRSKMPSIGLGTYQVTSKTDIYAIVDAALEAGYRFIDTAQVYKNEDYIGRALKELLPKYGLTREDIFITTKLSPANQGSSKVEPSLIRSLESLQTDYVDLFLIHWPGTSRADIGSPLNKTRRTESWTEMERLHQNGKCRAIGVSNYEIRHLEELLQQATILPAVNQCEYHPHYCQMDLMEYCAKNDIHFQAYSSFGGESQKQSLLNDPKVRSAAEAKGCSVPQFLLAWSLCQGLSVLPRSRRPEHVRSNFEARNVVLSSNEIEAVKAAHMKKHCWDPRDVA